ncbi:structural maintenance of chromosomes protein 1 [Trichomonascus vanleenenianus]|uniref:cohesin subunit SMC1 n=1 Tax=Trichomonascus vanleenenianus TaxID=2268995 RepID=UPI003ECA729D
MGRLKSIELYNFKSYHGVQKADFGSAHFTSIIGPNGSGKSNMMDAISFVLGIKSRELRSSHAKDLIYRGRRMEGDGAATQESDPTSAYVEALYIKDDGSDLRLKRTVARQGASEYRINNRVVSAQSYSEALARENILIKAKNFLVFQGDVDAIASQQPKDLSRLIEQISGAADFEADYNKLEEDKRLEAEKQSAVTMDRKRVAVEVKQLKEQQKETQLFQRKSNERDKLLRQHLLWRLYHTEQGAKEKENEYNRAEEAVDSARADVTTAEQMLEGVHAEQSEVRKAAIVVENKIKKKNRAIEKARNEVVPIRAKADRVKSNLRALRKRRDEIEVEYNKHRKAIEAHERNIDIANKALERFEQEIGTRYGSQGFSVTQEDLAEYQRLKDSYTEQTSKEQSDLNNLRRQQKMAQDQVDIISENKEQLVQRLERLRAEYEDQQVRARQLEASIADDDSERTTKRQELDQLTRQSQQRERNLSELNSKLRKTLEELSDYDADQRETRKERQMREDGAALKRYIPGVYGFVYDLVDAEQDKYRTSIATVMGRNMNAVVVKSFRVATSCIEYLKENRMNVMSFIPLDTVIAKPIRSDYRGIAKGARLAIDTVKYSPEIEAAVQYVCGDTIICDNMEVAKDVRWKKKADVKVVTLDGSIIHKSNLMTGGQTASGGATQQWNDARVRNLRNLVDSLKQDIEELNSKSTDTAEYQLTSELRSLETRLDYNRTRLRETQEVVESRGREIEYAEKNLAELEPKLAQKQADVDRFQSEFNSIEESLDSVQQAVFGAFCSRIGIASFRDFDKFQSSTQREITSERTRYNQQLQRLQRMLLASQEALQEQERRLAANSGRVDREEVALRAQEEELAALETRIADLEREKSAMEEEVESQRAQVDRYKRLVKDHKDQVSAAQKALDEAIRQASRIKDEENGYLNTRFGILKDCKLQGTEVPLEEGSMDNIPVEQVSVYSQSNGGERDGEGDMSMSMSMSQAASEDPMYGIVIDFGDLTDDLMESSEPDVGEHLHARASELLAEMEATRTKIDINAASKLEERQAKLEELETQFTQVQGRAKEAKRRFTEVMNKRKDRYMRAFDHISGQIQGIYEELTRSPAVPTGGSASMHLDNEDEPYLGGIIYSVMPPFKRYQQIELLSGGEKTMAALALLFAIHSYQPSPFFVLDEVDAALDNANVASLAGYIARNCGENFQFIVISLKQGLFEHSQSLVGIHRAQVENSSKAIMLDLR